MDVHYRPLNSFARVFIPFHLSAVFLLFCEKVIYMAFLGILLFLLVLSLAI